jgi:hypothetical protein
MERELMLKFAIELLNDVADECYIRQMCGDKRKIFREASNKLTEIVVEAAKDERELEMSELEADIQSRADDKEEGFALNGDWKKFIRKQDGFEIFAVDGKWVRDNLSVIFGHGGHGYVHEFIPLNEIWVATHHYDDNKWNKCECDKGNKPVSQEYFDSCVAHEIAERKMMEKDKPYWAAHQKALGVEEELGLLSDPDGDSGKSEIPSSWPGF